MSARAISRILLSAAVIAPEVDLKCCKRSDLPLYEPEATKNVCVCKPQHHQKNAGLIEDTIRTLRLNIDGLFKEVRKYEDMTMGYVHEGVDNAQWLVEYLGDEDNQAPKAPAIAIGGLTGLIFGLRGGLFKKLVYTTIGSVGMAAVCYPKEAKEYGGMAMEEGYKYAAIAYNFAYGDNVSLTIPESSRDAKKVSATDDPCKWLETQKESGAYDRVKRGEVERCGQLECDDVPVRDEAGQMPIAYYEGDESCPCHLGSCMHPPSEDSCPAELPYPPPNLPDPTPCTCEGDEDKCDDAKLPRPS